MEVGQRGEGSCACRGWSLNLDLFLDLGPDCFLILDHFLNFRFLDPLFLHDLVLDPHVLHDLRGHHDLDCNQRPRLLGVPDPTIAH